MNKHEKYMREALKEAEKATSEGNAPFGAVIVDAKGSIKSRGHDTVKTSNDPSAHAEIVAVRKYCKKIKSKNLKGFTMYSTSEPCPMCLSVCLKANIDTYVYGAEMEKSAKLYLRAKDVQRKFKGFKFTLTGGILKKECLKQRG